MYPFFVRGEHITELLKQVRFYLAGLRPGPQEGLIKRPPTQCESRVVNQVASNHHEWDGYTTINVGDFAYKIRLLGNPMRKYYLLKSPFYKSTNKKIAEI